MENLTPRGSLPPVWLAFGDPQGSPAAWGCPLGLGKPSCVADLTFSRVSLQPGNHLLKEKKSHITMGVAAINLVFVVDGKFVTDKQQFSRWAKEWVGNDE